MVGYSDPCPCCGNKRRRSTLDRWATWPRPSSAAQHPRPAKFARSASDPTPSAVAAAVKENDILASPVPTDLSSPACPNPSPTASDPSQPAEAEPTAKVPCPFRCPPAPGITDKKEEEEEKKKKKKEAEMSGARRRESEKKEDKEWEMKTKAEIRVPEGVEIKICFRCACGNSEEVILP